MVVLFMYTFTPRGASYDADIEQRIPYKYPSKKMTYRVELTYPPSVSADSAGVATIPYSAEYKLVGTPVDNSIALPGRVSFKQLDANVHMKLEQNGQLIAVNPNTDYQVSTQFGQDNINLHLEKAGSYGPAVTAIKLTFPCVIKPRSQLFCCFSSV